MGFVGKYDRVCCGLGLSSVGIEVCSDNKLTQE